MLDAADGQRIVGMTLNGKPRRPGGEYRVAINNFLASGGDGFYGLQGRHDDKVDLDLDARCD